MQFRRLLVCSLLSLWLAFPATAQQAPLASAQGPALLRQALAALNSGAPISDVTSSGTARRIAGSDDDAGTFTFKALAGTGSRLDLSLSSGTRTEVRSISAGNLTGSWSGPDGVAHPIAYHNLLIDIGLFPTLPLAAFISSPNAVITYVGVETRSSQAVQHISLSQPPPFPDPDGTVSYSHLSQVDFFLDVATLLPAALTFNIHPDNNVLLDIPVEIRFSDYRSVNGAEVPFHVQKFLNNGLVLDLQLNSVVLNTGLSASEFSVQ